MSNGTNDVARAWFESATRNIERIEKSCQECRQDKEKCITALKVSVGKMETYLKIMAGIMVPVLAALCGVVFKLFAE